ncbi:glycosyltransferase [Macrococcus lamae]|nr:glycosyltransferase [Macrococcus lamae]
MKKILIIADYFRPGYKAGGPIKSVYNLAKELSGKFNVYILTRNHDLNEKEVYKLPADQWTNFEGLNVYYDSTDFSKATYEEIKLQSYDSIYLNSIFSTTTIKFLLFQKNKANSIFVSPRGELGQGALSLKSNKKRTFLKLATLYNLYKEVNFIGSASEEVTDIKKYFPKNVVYEISNLSNVSSYKFVNNKKSKELNLYFVSRISRKKNIKFLLELLDGINGKICLKIIGPEEDKEYFQECEQVISRLSNNIKIEFLGSVKPEMIYNEAMNCDFFVLPTLNENFGHVIAEAISYKKPVIISNNTPWTDYINDNKLGFSIELDKILWKTKLNEALLMNDTSYAAYETAFEIVNNDLKANNKLITESYTKIFS